LAAWTKGAQNGGETEGVL